MCYLDMDGVLTDFIGGACRAHQVDNPYNRPEALGEWHLEKLLGISANHFWRVIDEDPGFWVNLEKTDEADKIVQFAIEEFGVDRIAFLTAPALDDSCLTGKRAWIKRYYPQITGGITFAKDKGLYGHYGAWLIDDKPENCEAFSENGGIAMLLPRPWNGRTEVVMYPIEEVESDYNC
jgi:5'(3')-deoxyribonucleotidase